MEEMKIRFCLILSLLFCVCLCSCASTPVAEGGAVSETQDAYKEKKQSHKKLLFEDWKHKGFGQSLPVWFEAAYKGDVEEVRRKIAVSDDYEIKIITAQGINSDQANKSLWMQLYVMSQLFELYDQAWVLLNEKEAATRNNSYPYYAAAVILIDNKQE